MDNIHELCFLTQGEENNHRKEELYRLTFDEDNRVAFNTACSIKFRLSQ